MRKRKFLSIPLLEIDARSNKHRSVSESLSLDRGYRSNQGEVWNDISRLQSKSNHHSPTGAMSDAFKANESTLNECLASLPLQEGQQGLAVIIDSKVEGIDFISRSGQYSRSHEKLLRSYVISALLEKNNQKDAAASGTHEADLVRLFISKFTGCRISAHPSVGYGEDHRFEVTGFTGSALMHEGQVVHLSFLNLIEMKYETEEIIN